MPRLVHNVFFSLLDPTSEAKAKLVADCHKYLTVQPGIVFFAAGVIDAELNRPVNVLDWDVGLHVVFENRAAHDAYQVEATHLKFIEENKPTWKAVKVFDSLAD